jgi:chaperonin GroES
MNITPISDVVVIRRQEQSTVSGGGIFLPHADELREDIGTVMFVGRGKPHKCKKCAGTTHIPMQVRAGDRVIFSTNGHQITKVNGEELIVLRQDSIIAVIEDETEVSSSRGIQQVQQFFVSGEK